MSVWKIDGTVLLVSMQSKCRDCNQESSQLPHKANREKSQVASPHCRSRRVEQLV